MKYVPFSSSWHSVTWNTYSWFQSQDEGSALDVTMWEELEDLVLERALPMAVVLCLSQLSRPLSSSSYDGIQDLPGLLSVNGHYRTPVVLGGYFFDFFWRGFTYMSDNSFSELRSPSLDQRSQAPDNCTVSEMFSLRALPGAFLYLIFWGCCFPQSRCMAIFL